MTWPQINDLVKRVVSQIDDVSEEVKRAFENHASNYVATVVVLTPLAMAALLLVAFNFVRPRHPFGKVKKGFPSNVEVVRKNLQEFVKIWKMSVGKVNLDTHQSPPFYAPPALPYYGPRALQNFNYDHLIEATPFPGNPSVKHSKQSSTQTLTSPPTAGPLAG